MYTPPKKRYVRVRGSLCLSPPSPMGVHVKQEKTKMFPEAGIVAPRDRHFFLSNLRMIYSIHRPTTKSALAARPYSPRSSRTCRKGMVSNACLSSSSKSGGKLVEKLKKGYFSLIQPISSSLLILKNGGFISPYSVVPRRT